MKVLKNLEANTVFRLSTCVYHSLSPPHIPNLAFKSNINHNVNYPHSVLSILLCIYSHRSVILSVCGIKLTLSSGLHDLALDAFSPHNSSLLWFPLPSLIYSILQYKPNINPSLTGCYSEPVLSPYCPPSALLHSHPLKKSM